MDDKCMNVDENKICIGIDLGTTNTSAALMSPGKANPADLEILQKSKNRTMSMQLLPSIMYRKSDGEEVVGYEAEDLKENNVVDEKSGVRYLENLKRYIGTQRTFTIDDEVYTPIDVAQLILEHVKKYSQINKIKGEFYTVITVPAKFRTDQRNATLEAARRAGFDENNVELYDEPKAAILSFLHEDSQKVDEKTLDLSEKKRILVIDIGGGTCDICVEDVEEKDGRYVFGNLAIGREDLGGVDFDVRIGDELAKQFLRDIELNAADIASLRTVGQKIKEQISSEVDYYLYSEYDGDDAALYGLGDWLEILANEIHECTFSKEIHGETVHFKMGVRELYNAISPLICQTSDVLPVNKDDRALNKNMEALINTTLNDYDIKIDDIDYIFLTGGMAKCFLLKAILHELYQKPIISPSDPLLAVSRGASLVSRYRSIDETSRDRLANAIMIETDDGRLETLVSMGTEVPAKGKASKIFKTQSRTGVAIRLFEGKNEFDCQMRRINNSFTIKFNPPQSIGREFEIAYSVDRTKRINFTISFLDTKKEHHIDAQVKEIE